MKLRAPAVPLITVDPYFSVWSTSEILNYRFTKHWTGKNQRMYGNLLIDGREYSFLGFDRNVAKMDQISLDIDALSTKAVFEAAGIRLNARFMTPLIPDDIHLLSRPVSYLSLTYENTDGKSHEVVLKYRVSCEICLDYRGQYPVTAESVGNAKFAGLKMGSTVQKPLSRSGDDLRIDWGYFYLATADATVRTDPHTFDEKPSVTTIGIRQGLSCKKEALLLFGYDDGVSIRYFGKDLKSPWYERYGGIENAIACAVNDYPALVKRCDKFSKDLYDDALKAGGEKYAELLSLSYRQVIAAHKLVRNDDGELLFISKECFSNGCAATVDVSYPSIPMFLLYNPELVRAMMRPIYKFASSRVWKCDFAPHDAGRYPLVMGQLYGFDHKDSSYLSWQMPVEECGNMIVMETCALLADGNTDFPKSHFKTLKKWCEYLIRFGDDPENQLCTDDFAGHLAHNCNLSLKAIMGIMGMSIICKKLHKYKDSANYAEIAKKMAASWLERAANGDGSYKLAFDKPGTFSMKYNMVWDKIWGTNLFPKELVDCEIESYKKHENKYGLPLDNRAEYTKSDWLVWTATMASSKKEFMRMIAPLWQAYNDTEDRVAMSDWYDTKSADHIEFVHRSVQGGLFIKLLSEKKILKVKK